MINKENLDIIIKDVTWSYEECGDEVPQNILDTLNEIKQIFKNQPTFEQCIKKWNEKGFDVDIYALEIVIANYSTAKCEADEVEFSIDLLSKQVSIPNRCWAKLPFKIYHLLSKTLKALEEMKDDKN